MQDVKEPQLEEIVEPVKAPKWCRLIFLKDGRHCFGCLIYDSEEEAAKESTIVNSTGCLPRTARPMDMVCTGWTKPNKQGSKITHLNSEYSHHIPYPLTNGDK